MKIRNKLIRLLGGRTEEEYRFLADKMKVRPPVYSCEMPIVRLKAGYTCRYPLEDPSEEWIREKLAEDIAKKMLEDGLITFVSRDIECSERYVRPPEIIAEARVARPVISDK